MGLTVTNVNSLALLNILNRTAASQSDTLLRLSTGSRINAGKDDPAGLIAMNNLQSSLTATNAAIQNNQRTDSILKVADNALGEVTTLLDQIQSLAQKSANTGSLSASEIASNQAQLDNAIAAIDRIIGTTEFNGRKLLDGSLGIEIEGATNNVRDVQIFSRNTQAGATTVSVKRTSSAEYASGVLASGASFSMSGSASFQIGGKLGVTVIDVASGSSLTDIRDQVNQFKVQTGVSASITSGVLSLSSTDYGSRAFVSVTRLTSEDTNTASAFQDSGVDAGIMINGRKAAVDGLNVNFNGNGLSLSFNISKDFNATGTTTDFTVTTRGGATFQLGTDASSRSTIGLDGLFSQRLGGNDLGYLSSLRSGNSNDLLTDAGKAFQIAARAKEQIANVRGRLGGFQKFQVETALNQQNAVKEGLTAALSTIKDIDYATETAELSRQNVLLQSAISLMGVANQQSAQILSLLR